MLKRTVSLILTALLMLSLFSGCNTTPVETTAPTSSDPTQATRPVRPTETTAPTEETEPTEPPYVPLPPEESRPAQPAEDPINPGILADQPNTENGVYASCGNFYYTMYLDGNKDSVQFYLLTEQPLPQGSKLQSNLKTVTRVDLYKAETGGMSWNYMMLADWLGADIDWAAYWQLRKTFNDTLFDWDAGKSDYNTLLAAYNAERAYYKRLDEFLPAARQLQKDWDAGKPFFYVYEATIHLRGYTQDEDLTEVELVAGDMSRTIPIGRIRLRERMDPSTVETNKLAIKDPVTPVEFKGNEANTLSEPRSADVLEMKWDFVAQRDMTLTDAYFFANGGEGCTIVGAEVQITKTDGKSKKLGQPRVVTWTLGTPLEVKKNEQVECRVYYEDPRTQMTDYGAKHYMVLEYTCEGVSGKVLSSSEKCLRKWYNWINQYFWAFTDYDFMAYTEEFAWPQNQYVEEHNGEWPEAPQFPAS